MFLEKAELLKLTNALFEDKWNQLTANEREVEMIKLIEGLAPDRPSFIVNQENAVKTITNSFNDLYAKTLNMQFWLLVSNFGNGKSHILNTIKSSLEPVANNILINISARGKSTFDFISIILKNIDRELIRREIGKVLKEINWDTSDDVKYIDDIASKTKISKDLAKIFFYIKRGNSIQIIQALDVLTTQTKTKDIFKALNLAGNFDLEGIIYEFFYFLIDCLKKSNRYIVLLVEEFENVFKWNKRDRMVFYEQLKEFTNNSTKLGNLYIMLVATNIFNDEIEEKNNKAYQINDIDPALYDRLKARIIKLDYLKTENEVKNLVKKIAQRYKAYYNYDVCIDTVMEILPSRLNAITYRSYIQTISAIVEDLKSQKLSNINSIGNNLNETIINLENKQKEIQIVEEKINNEIYLEESPNAMKKKLISALKKLLEFNDYRIIGSTIRPGYIIAKPKSKRNQRMFYVAFSTIESSSSIFKRLQGVSDLAAEQSCDRNNIYFIYLKESVSEKAANKIAFYNPSVIKTIAIEEHDLINILLLIERNKDFSDEKKAELAKGYSEMFMLETGERNE